MGVMRQVINMNTSDPGVMQLFETALTTLQQQGDSLSFRCLHCQACLHSLENSRVQSTSLTILVGTQFQK